MRLKDCGETVNLWLSADDTERWARSWPCSQLRGRRLFAQFDRSGLLELAVDGKDAPDDLDANEFNACTSDHLARRLPKEHPCWFVTVGQFR